MVGAVLAGFWRDRLARDSLRCKTQQGHQPCLGFCASRLILLSLRHVLREFCRASLSKRVLVPVVLSGVLCAACTTPTMPSTSTSASTPAVGVSASPSVPNPDPFEPFNRAIYRFNDRVDRVVFKPIARGYQAVTPQPVRNGISRFFSHWGSLWSVINSTLQGKGDEALQTWMRFNVNLIFGLGGFLDPATEMGLANPQQDLGLTLAHWGVPSGPYVVLPFLGPSTLRDMSNPLVSLSGGDPVWQSIPPQQRLGFLGLRLLDTRSQLLGLTDTVDQVALDPYRFMRDAYLQRRRALTGQPNSAGLSDTSGTFESFDDVESDGKTDGKSGAPASASDHLVSVKPTPSPQAPVRAKSGIAHQKKPHRAGHAKPPALRAMGRAISQPTVASQGMKDVQP
jgi:phospholipid-binding lipoprotein MlaA